MPETGKTKLNCSNCGVSKIDDDLTMEADGSRLCGECWLTKGIASGKFKVKRPRGRPQGTTKPDALIHKITVKVDSKTYEQYQALGPDWVRSALKKEMTRL